MRKLLPLVLVFAATGCSFALVSGPPANHQQLPAFECTTSRVGPGLDTVWTVLQTLNLIYAASITDVEWDANLGGSAPYSRKTGIGVYAGVAALGAAGMWYGFSRTGECRNAKSELMLRSQQGVPTGPATGTWPPPPTPPLAAPVAPAPAPAPVPEPAPAPPPP